MIPGYKMLAMTLSCVLFISIALMWLTESEFVSKKLKYDRMLWIPIIVSVPFFLLGAAKCLYLIFGMNSAGETIGIYSAFLALVSAWFLFSLATLYSDLRKYCVDSPDDGTNYKWIEVPPNTEGDAITVNNVFDEISNVNNGVTEDIGTDQTPAGCNSMGKVWLSSGFWGEVYREYIESDDNCAVEVNTEDTNFKGMVSNGQWSLSRDGNDLKISRIWNGETKWDHTVWVKARQLPNPKFNGYKCQKGVMIYEDAKRLFISSPKLIIGNNTDRFRANLFITFLNLMTGFQVVLRWFGWFPDTPGRIEDFGGKSDLWSFFAKSGAFVDAWIATLLVPTLLNLINLSFQLGSSAKDAYVPDFVDSVDHQEEHNIVWIAVVAVVMAIIIRNYMI